MKKTLAYIGKVLQGGLVLTAALALIGGSVLCCCLSKTAHASAVKKGCCHKAEKSAPSKTCDHCKIKAADSDHFVQSFNIVPVFAKHLNSFWTADAFVYKLPARFSTYLACAGPRASTIPIYLLFPSLRL